MKKAISVIIILMITTFNSTFSQSQFELPQNIELKAKEDHSKYEQTVIDAARWLETTDLDKEVEKRKNVSSFIMRWVSGSPTVSIELTEPIGKLVKDNPELLLQFLASYSRSVLENKTSPSKFIATKDALKAVVNVYAKGIGISKVKELEKLKKLTTEDEIDRYVTGTLNIPRS